MICFKDRVFRHSVHALNIARGIIVDKVLDTVGNKDAERHTGKEPRQ